MPGKRLSEDQRQQIIGLYTKGHKVAAVARRVQCSERSVLRVLEYAGVPIRYRFRKGLNQDELTQAEFMLNDGASFAEVARTIGCSRQSVARRFPGKGWTMKQTWDNMQTVKLAKKLLGDGDV